MTVESEGQSVKSIVRTDDAGTITLISTPQLHLTAHDKQGHLLFDGVIDTAEQRAQVPHDLWKRVEPLLKKMNSKAAREAEDS